MMMMMMMNCFCGMVDRRKAISLISSQNHCQRSSLSRISDTLRAGFEPAQSLSLGLVEWSCEVMITTTPRRYTLVYFISTSNHMFGRAIWDKLREYICGNFEKAGVKPGKFQNFQKLGGWFIPKIARTKHVITG